MWYTGWMAEDPPRRPPPLTAREEIEYAARAFMWLMRLRDPRPEVPFLAMPPGVVQLIAERLALGPSDTVVDIGCGEGRLLAQLTGLSGCAGVGLERDPARAAGARALEAGLRIVEGDFEIEADLDRLGLAQATAVVLFLYPWAVELLLPRLVGRLNPQARIVSYCFSDPLLATGPREMVPGFAYPGHTVPLYVWTVPAVQAALAAG